MSQLRSGILLLDKPAGITSAEALNRLKRRHRFARIGHGGTLDPFATGLMLVLLGEATKIARFLLEGEKAYEAEARLGNIQGQLVNSIELDRQAAESRIRRQLERVRDQARTEIDELNRAIAELDERLSELEQAASVIRGRLGITPETAAEEDEEAEEPPTVLDTGEAADDFGRP